jgi:hypothetical protein
MTVIELSDEQAAALKAKAAAQGLSLEAWLEKLSAEEEQPARLSSDTPADPGGDTRPIWEVMLDNLKGVPPEEFAALPKDGASQVDHYLYGHPKRSQ